MVSVVGGATAGASVSFLGAGVSTGAAVSCSSGGLGGSAGRAICAQLIVVVRGLVSDGLGLVLKAAGVVVTGKALL